MHERERRAKGLDDEREALREVVPWAAVEPHALVLLPRDDLTFRAMT
jgi:hypothetical protein